MEHLGISIQNRFVFVFIFRTEPVFSINNKKKGRQTAHLENFSNWSNRFYCNYKLKSSEFVHFYLICVAEQRIILVKTAEILFIEIMVENVSVIQ